MESQSENISAQGREHLMEEYLYLYMLTKLRPLIGVLQYL